MVERMTLSTPRPPISTPSSPRRVGVMGVTNRRECVSARGPMSSSFSPRPGLLPPTPRDKTKTRPIKGAPSYLSRDQHARDSVDANRREEAVLKSLSDSMPFKTPAFMETRANFERPTVLEVGPMEPSTGTDLTRRGPPPAAAPAASSSEPVDVTLLPQRERIELAQLRRDAATVASVRNKTVDGHAEAAMTVMREFFSNRPMDALFAVLRDMDVDKSNTIEENEFATGLRKLNMELSDRDIHAVFSAADKDGSGKIEIDEFFNTFRRDSFPRDTFFWSKTRPRGLLSREDRVQMAQKLGAGGFERDYSAADVLEVVQRKVDQFSVKAVFNSLDDNRSGRVSVREFVQALRGMDILVPDARAEAIIAELNERVGDPRPTHLTYRSFCNAFAPGTHEGTTGDDSGVVPIPGEKIWRKSAAGEAEAKRKPLRPDMDDTYMDSIQRFQSSMPSMAAIGRVDLDRGKVYSDAADKLGYTIGKHDTLAAWRGMDGNITGKDGVTIGTAPLGRDVDWFDFKKDKEHKLLTREQIGEQHNVSLPGSLPLAARPSLSARAAPAPAPAALDEAPATVRGCLMPPVGSPAYVNEVDRLSPRPGNWICPDSGLLRDRKLAKQQAATARREAHETKMQRFYDWERAHADGAINARSAVQTAYAARTADWQQVVESKIATVGVRTVLLEPASADDRNWAFAPPHRTSHWDTIAGHNFDPPSRVHVKQITSYRKAFPDADYRPPTPRRPQWGGAEPPLTSTC